MDGLLFNSSFAGECNPCACTGYYSFYECVGGGFGAAGGGSYLYLTYVSDREKTALLNVSGDAALFFNGVTHAGDPYSSGWLYIPVRLKKGLNEIYIRPSGLVAASLIFPAKEIQLNTEDATLPVVQAGAAGNDTLYGAVVVINATSKPLKGGRIRSTLGGKTAVSELPVVPAMSTRKVPFAFNGSSMTAKGNFKSTISLLAGDRSLDEKELSLEAAAPGEQYSVTFISGIDGSLQYYAVTPAGTVFAPGTTASRIAAATPAGSPGSPALFLSVHGAGVEAIGQARAYRPKDWGTLVAATNRRPRGFNWEDWGRLDALEVLALAKERFKPDPQHIYLTGHSMGGHGTWFLGAAYPDKWAAIGACSGYPTLKEYGSHDGVVPDSGASPVERLLLRASDQSDVIRLATNYKSLGVYILHGDSDKVVPVKYAREMRKVLGGFQTDMSYYEYPGGEHWFGNQCVDWKPLFDFFQWHSRKPDSLVNQIDFMTASPGISASSYWASIQQQLHPLAYSHIQLARDPLLHKITGKTENVQLLGLSLTGFSSGTKVSIFLDSLPPVLYTTTGANDSLFLLKGPNTWTLSSRPGAHQKNPQRYGTLKEAFNNQMVFVYGTSGAKEENEWSLNKARYDAETWYYRGNGAVDIIADKEFSPDAYAGRGVILFGNAGTNAAWRLLLEDCPIRVERGRIRVGDKLWEGDDLGACFVWPLRNSPVTSVAVIGGSGLKGMEAANANQYFAGASGFPDFMLFRLDMLQAGSSGVKMAGFFDNDWKLAPGEWEENPQVFQH
ncbi:MAG TPA: alpha/beta hydrolase-fold protein [Puia sp.]|nr:alpha/beta hydrolase-fold protein [Puia sp.]